MALIKGKRFRPDDEPDPKKDKSGEEHQRRGGLIKRKSLSSKFLSDNALPPEYGDNKSRVRRSAASGKVLKAKWTSILKPAGETKHFDQERAQDTSIMKEDDFRPASFMTQPGAGENQDRSGPRNVVMVPAGKKKSRGDAEAGDGEFSVEQADPRMNVDVEAVIAEAEQKGREKAAKIIEHAQAEAKKLIDQAKIYGETAKQEAHREGMKQGKEDGYREGLAQFQAQMEQAKELCRQLINDRRKVLETVEPELAHLSIQIAEKVIGEELKTNSDAVLSIVKAALAKMKSREQVTIKVHPDDLTHVENNRDIFAAMVEGIKDLEITADPRVDRGGCLIVTNLGNTDARISTQLGAIELAFNTAETGEF